MSNKLNDLLKQAQQMQAKMQEAQRKLEDTEVTGESGGGLVRVTMTGRHNIIRIHIDDSLLEEPKSMLEDLIVAACNDAVRKVEETSRKELSSLTSGMQLPGDLSDLMGGAA
jgi:hypothetical protein